ncbi:MAG TPA: hypothetical protein VHL11_04335 [Phototrophicaceae bacterium]|jgi:hypothetical protein|nr:hypothetical protein [Phototrophicaceae bacterium]
MRRLISFVSVMVVLAVTVFTVTASSRAVPPAPVLVSPADGETVNTHSPLLQWTGSDADVFKVLVKNSANEKVLKVNASPVDACTGSDCSLSPSLNGVDFLNDTFTWKVIAKNVDGKASSTKFSFTVDFPGTPTLLSPAPDYVGPVSGFSWEPVAAAEQYRLRVKNLTSGEKLVLLDWTNAGDICGATCDYLYEGTFDEGVSYKWWVEARQITFPNVSKSDKWKFTQSTAR